MTWLDDLIGGADMLILVPLGIAFFIVIVGAILDLVCDTKFNDRSGRFFD